MTEQYRKQVELLVETLPLVAREVIFALKGGTAINLFYRDKFNMQGILLEELFDKIAQKQFS